MLNIKGVVWNTAKQITGWFGRHGFLLPHTTIASFSDNGERAPFMTHLLTAKSTCLKSVALTRGSTGAIEAYQEGNDVI